MNVMRFTIIEPNHVISFVAPWNALKALTAACSSKITPTDFTMLLEAASKYDTGLGKYVFDNLAIFDENNASLANDSEPLSALLEQQLNELLASKYQANREKQSYISSFGEVEVEAGETISPADSTPTAATSFSEIESSESEVEITYEELAKIQREIAAKAAAYHPVFRVSDNQTRQKSQEPVGVGLVIFNLTAKRIIQVQNSFGQLQRSDRGRYHENGYPTERLYFYRLPNDWSIVP
jgi:hypothetical protein